MPILNSDPIKHIAILPDQRFTVTPFAALPWAHQVTQGSFKKKGSPSSLVSLSFPFGHGQGSKEPLSEQTSCVICQTSLRSWLAWKLRPVIPIPLHPHLSFSLGLEVFCTLKN